MKIQPWEYHEANMPHDGFCYYLGGQVIDYISRYRRKNGITDLKKAAHILEKLIEVETKKENEQFIKEQLRNKPITTDGLK